MLRYERGNKAPASRSAAGNCIHFFPGQLLLFPIRRKGTAKWMYSHHTPRALPYTSTCGDSTSSWPRVTERHSTTARITCDEGE